ncbi:hypothetical protein [Legionella qingyii]|uniref:hypothetical protein n=1 Tax=Legionella qingyii TaxID=2184757 RepID=UPI000F8F73CF|nr:hypothetical protein [Legionella qingyii]RUR26939.1 hypothetical protein ELY16_06810 [Legionella qingyii]
MPGYLSIHPLTFPNLFRKEKISIEEITTPAIRYELERSGNVIIMHTPIKVASLKKFFDDLAAREDLSQMHVLLGVIGQGATEDHIVTMHLPPGKQPQVYDSKYSNPERFFSTAPSKNTIIGMLSAAFHSLNPFASPEQHVDLNHLGSERINSATYHAFGTQSFFDGVTCGYHTAQLIKIFAPILEHGDNPNPSELLNASINPVTSSAKILEENAPDLVQVSFFSFLKKAWQDTFLTLTDPQFRNQYHFGHYFLGWPSDPKGSKIAYFLTLKFITAPLTNLLSLAIEFPLNFLSETCSFLKNRILSWAPTNWLTQSLRSVLLLTTMGLQGLFKGANYLIRTITSPIVSFKEAQKVHPALGYLSALASICFIGAAIAALAFFAPPIVAALMPSIGPGALAVLSTLAYPFVQLFSLISVSIPAATGAMLSLITGASFLGALHQLGRNTIYPQKSQVITQRVVNIEVSQEGSNVSKHLSAQAKPVHETTSIKKQEDSSNEWVYLDEEDNSSQEHQRQKAETQKAIGPKNNFNPNGIQDNIEFKF